MAHEGYAALLRELAGAPHGLILIGPDYAAARAAQEAGLVSIEPAVDVDVVVLTDAGRRSLGLPPKTEKALAKLTGRLFGWLAN